MFYIRHYATFEAVKILMGKINIPTVFNIPFSTRWPLAVMYQYRSARSMIFDSSLWHVSRMLVELKPAQYSIDGV